MRIVPLTPGQNATRVVSVASGKGGVGKTSTTVGLAFALAKMGNRVCILDADLGLSNVDIVLGVEPVKTLEDVLFQGLPMADAVLPVAPGVDLVSGASGVPRLAELTRTERRRLVAQFKELNDYDYLIVDNSPGITSQIVSICMSSRDLVVVTTPDATALTDAYALIKVLAREGLWWSPFVCVNRAKSRKQARLVYEKIRSTAGKHLSLGCRYLGCVLEDEAVSMAAALRKPVTEVAPRSQAAQDMADLAQALDGADAPGRRRDVSPLRFLDGSIMRLKQGHTALKGITGTARRYRREAARKEAPPMLDTAPLLEGLARMAQGLDALDKPGSEAERGRVLRTLRAELTAMRTALTMGNASPASRPAERQDAPVQSPSSADQPLLRPVPHQAPPRPEEQEEELPPPRTSGPGCAQETLPGMHAALAALAEATAEDAARAAQDVTCAPRPQAARSGKALLVCPQTPMREVLAEMLSDAGLAADVVHPRALNGGNHFAGYDLGLVCWDAPADDLERVVAKTGETPVVMLRGFRRKPEHEPNLDGLPVTVLYKPFQVKTLYGAIKRAAQAH